MKNRPDTLPVKIRFPFGWKEVNVPVQYAPFSVMMFYGDPPKFLDSNDYGPVYKAMVKNYNEDNVQRVLASTGGLELEYYRAQYKGPPFQRLKAKIAHSFAVAELGVDAFKPFLRKFIRNKHDTKGFDFIGGSREEKPPTHNLHELNIRRLSHDGKELIIVDVRLFANQGFPQFEVIVGEAHSST